MTVTADDIARARAALGDVARRTPVLGSLSLSEACGGTIVLKAESLQRTGSFKLRGALAKLELLGGDASRGVVAGSAGNHAQSLAYAARARGVPCEVYLPAEAPLGKAQAAEEMGARLIPGGDTVAECVDAAREHAERTGMTFVHPYDDPDIVAGQGTLGLELLEDVPDLARVVVPVGGGGLAAGVAIAVRSARPEVEVVGVRAEARGSLTIADGIAIKHPGEVTGPLLDEWVTGRAEAAEDDTAEAMVALLERAKLVVEGAGAVGLAALTAGTVKAAPEGTTAVVLSGGNVDPGLLAAIARRHESEAGRRLVLLTRVSDQPGGLAALLTRVAATGANIVEVSHVREGLDLHVRETAIELVLETRGPGHADEVIDALREDDYAVDLLR